LPLFREGGGEDETKKGRGVLHPLYLDPEKVEKRKRDVLPSGLWPGGRKKGKKNLSAKKNGRCLGGR